MTKTIEQARREAFEALFPVPEWVEFHGAFYSGGESDTALELVMINIRWSCYNAAMDSLCITLPLAAPNYMDDSEESCFLSGVHACREAIHAAGVKTR